MPSLDKLHREWKSQGFVLLGIDDEEPSAVREFYAKNNLSFPTLIDSKRAVRRHYGDDGGVPMTVILDRKGRIVSRVEGTRTEAQWLRMMARAGIRPRGRR